MCVLHSRTELYGLDRLTAPLQNTTLSATLCIGDFMLSAPLSLDPLVFINPRALTPTTSWKTILLPPSSAAFYTFRLLFWAEDASYQFVSFLIFPCFFKVLYVAPETWNHRFLRQWRLRKIGSIVYLVNFNLVPHLLSDVAMLRREQRDVTIASHRYSRSLQLTCSPPIITSTTTLLRPPHLCTGRPVFSEYYRPCFWDIYLGTFVSYIEWMLCH